LSGTLAQVGGTQWNFIPAEEFDGTNGLVGGSYRYLKFVELNYYTKRGGLNEIMVFEATADVIPEPAGLGLLGLVLLATRRKRS